LFVVTAGLYVIVLISMVFVRKNKVANS
jgi:hypothetical protein